MALLGLGRIPYFTLKCMTKQKSINKIYSLHKLAML